MADREILVRLPAGAKVCFQKRSDRSGAQTATYSVRPVCSLLRLKRVWVGNGGRSLNLVPRLGIGSDTSNHPHAFMVYEGEHFRLPYGIVHYTTGIKMVTM